ncbi:hypothetical protein HPB48_010573 [Haemaphysalis longicornis]|uniref:Uncharacterized protein n=1 Tax=Haemaphysalis longicornis TaxID=44386 RepID=A0A9J6H206_HAELO|nr:hypothetical protein HPB48_010573 [Haemaphysalis longicornis]
MTRDEAKIIPFRARANPLPGRSQRYLTPLRRINMTGCHNRTQVTALLGYNPVEKSEPACGYAMRSPSEEKTVRSHFLAAGPLIRPPHSLHLLFALSGMPPPPLVCDA